MKGKHLAMATAFIVVIALCMAPIAASDIVAPGPGGNSGGGPGGGGSSGGGSGGDSSSSSSITWSGATEITTSGTSQTGQAYVSSTSDEIALLIDGATGVTITDPTVTKSGGPSQASDNYNFYGINSGIVAKDGATVTITGGTVSTTANGANGVFSYGGSATTNNSTSDGTTVTISGTVITTIGDNAGGLMTTGGGITDATDLTVTTGGNSSAALRTDRGGGTVTVTGGSYTSNGTGSPAIYCTADITADGTEFVSTASEGVCIEGLNSVTLSNCKLTATNDQRNGNATFYDTIMIYQSQSGDAASGTSSFTMTKGTLTSNNGHVFHVTNTDAVITLSGVTIVNNDSDDILLSVCDDGWSGASNIATLNASGQTLSGTILVGSDSTLTVSLADSSVFTGTFSGMISNASGTSVSTSLGTVSVTLDSTSSWTLTADTYIGSFSGDLSNVYSGDGGYSLYVNDVKQSISSGTSSTSDDDTKYAVNFPSDLTVTVDGSAITSGTEVASGTVLTVTVSDRTGYTATVSPSLTDGTYTVTDDVTFTVSYTADTYTVTYYVDDSLVHQDSYTYGSTVTAYAYTPATGKEVSDWSPVLPDTMPAEDLAVYATTSAIQCKVSYADGLTVTVGGSSLASGDYVDYGTEIAVTAESRTGYTATVTPALSNGKYTVTGDVSFDISYTADTVQYEVTYADGITVMNGTASVASGSKVDSGTVLTVTAEDRAGYTATISPSLTDGSYTVISDVTFEVSYEANTYTVTYQVDGETVNTVSYEYGAEIMAYSYTKDGATVSDWSPSLPATMPAENLVVSATTTAVYSTDVKATMQVETDSSGKATAVSLMMIANDDAVIASGTITVTYTYTAVATTPFGIATVLLSDTFDVGYTADKACAYVTLDFSGVAEYSDIVGASAVFSDGSSDYRANVVAFMLAES